MIHGTIKTTPQLPSLNIKNVMCTTNFYERMRGLLFRPMLNDTDGLLISPCPSIHTIGMTYPIDVIFMDKTGRVLKIVEKIKPFRFASCRGANSALELSPGAARSNKLETGMTLNWKKS